MEEDYRLNNFEIRSKLCISFQKQMDKSMLVKIQKITCVQLVPFSSGRREGANLSSLVIVLPNLEFLNHFVDQLCYFKLGILIPSLRTYAPGDRSHPYRKDRWRLHFYFCDLPSRAGNRYDNYHQLSFGFEMQKLLYIFFLFICF